jgi:excisionase family DNA binding protein
MLKPEKQNALEESRSRQPITPRWLKIPAAVAYSGISRSVMYELLNAGKIRSHRIGAARVIDRESLDEFIAGQPPA